jgi:SUKH-3 immunity protein
MSFQLSVEAERVLRQAGWYPERHAAPEGLVRRLESIGFTVSVAAYNFIDHFCFLTIEHMRKWPHFLRFDPGETLNWIRSSDIPYLSALTGRSLCPIGHGGGSLLFMSPNAEVIILNDEWMGWGLIRDVGQALDHLLGIRRAEMLVSELIAEQQRPPGFKSSPKILR